MNSKHYLAIYDEQKLIADFFHNNLERFHQYDILFSCSEKETLLSMLHPQVKLLLVHPLKVNETLSQFLNSVLNNFPDLKMLVYTNNVAGMESALQPFTHDRVKIVSSHHGYPVFFNALEEMIPGCEKQDQKVKLREYKTEGFERLKKNRQWLYILSCVEKGQRPKEMETEGLRYKTINAYIEEMIKETGCGNITELYAQAKKRSII